MQVKSRETNFRLQELNADLAEQNRILLKVNRKLKARIEKQARTEEMLRRRQVHYRKLCKEARVMQKELRQFSRWIIRLQEEERKFISRELHQGTSQALTAVSVTLAGFKADLARGAGVSEQKLALAQRLLQGTMVQLHDVAHELRPAVLDDLGLLPALRTFLSRFASETGMQVSFRADPSAEQLASGSKTALFRVVQDRLTNVVRQEQAHRVDVVIRRIGQRISMIVRDDGQPARAGAGPAVEKKPDLGPLGMRERMRLIHGDFDIRSSSGKGTSLRVAVPLARSGCAPA